MVCVMLFLLFATKSTYAQLKGTIDVPSANYPSIRSVVDSLNLYGVGLGGVAFQVTAGYTETAPAGGIQLTASGTVNNPITIRRNPTTSGQNPIITAQVGTTTNLDGVFFLLGSDYITIDGIDIQESAANTTATTQMEFGYALLNRNASAPFDGCMNNTIKNCSVTLNKTNTATRGIYANHHVVNSVNGLTLTSSADAHSFNKFYANKIQNCFNGIFINGFDDPISPYAFKDKGNDVGGNSYATADTITNYGTAGSYGIFITNQTSVNASYNFVNNTLNGGAAATGALTGIYVIGSSALYPDLSGNSNVSFNTVNLSVASGSGLMTCIDVENFDGNLSVLNNNISWNNLATTTGTMNGIYVGHSTNTVTPGALSFKNNVAQNITFASTTATCNVMAVLGATQSTQDISGNTVTNVTRNATTTGATYLLRSGSIPGGLAGGTTSNIYNNTVQNITANNSGTSSMYALYATGNYTTSVYNNIIQNISAPTGIVSFFGIISDNASYLNIFNNQVSNISAAGNVYGIYSQILSGLLGQNIYANNISNITSLASGNFNLFGINSFYGALNFNNIYRNKIVGLSQLGTSTNSAQGIYIAQGYSSTTLAPFNIYNNVIAKIRAPFSTITANPSVIGINLFNQSNPYEASVSYNTILLNDTASATTNSACIFQNAVRNIRLNNNLLVNKTFHATGTGIASVIFRSGINLVSYHLLSNNNLLYAGAPSNRNVLFFDGTNRDSTLLSFKTRISPREGASQTANIAMFDEQSTPSITLSSNLYAQNDTTVVSAIENAAQNIAGITTDFRGITRQGNIGYTGTGTRPDIGAFESQGTGIAMNFDSVWVTKNNVNALVGVSNQPVVNIQVYISGSTGTQTATQFSLSTIGTTNVADLSGAKLFYTGASGAFSTATQFGSSISNPNGTFVINGTQLLTSGVNNFWLTYDVSGSAVVGRVIDAAVSNVIVSSQSKAPSNGNPTGSKTITAPLAGTYTIGNAPYTTLAAIITDLNANGISSSVTVNLPANFTETAPAGGYVLGSSLLNANLSLNKTLTFRKSGTGNNPLLSANIGTSTILDGIFTLVGADYVTFDGIDLIDLNTTSATTQMEWGFGLLKLNNIAPFDGSQNVTIKNATINLNRTNANSRGIYVNNHIVNDATLLAITSPADANSYNRFVSNTIQNVNTGIFINGYSISTSAVDFSLYDIGNTVGDSATTGNFIYNFAGAAAGFGVNVNNQMLPVITYNNIDNYNGGANGAIGATLLATGIQYANTFTASTNPTSPIVSNNTVILTAAQAATGGLTNIAVNCAHGDVKIENNSIKWVTLGTGITAGTLTGIYYNFNAANGGNFTANSLVFRGNVAKEFSYTCGGSANNQLFYLFGAANTEDISYDSIYNVTRIPHASTVYSGTATLFFSNTTSNPGISTVSSLTRNIHHNYIVGFNNGATSTGGVTGMNVGNTYNVNIYANTIKNLINQGGASGLNVALFCNAATQYTIYDNTIDSILSNAGSTWGINIVNSTGISTFVYRNTISNLSAGSASLYVAGLFVQSGGRNFNFYNNKIYNLNNTTTGTGYTVGAYYNNAGLTAINFTPARFYNNVIGNLSAATSTSSANPAVMGIGIGVTSPSSFPSAEIYYNTISLSGTTAINRNSTGIYMGGTATNSATFTLNNNIVVNNITPSGTGVASAVHRNSAVPLASTILASSNNNLYYAGTPSANKVIYFDGTNRDSTLVSFQNRMYPRESNSVTENCSFLSTIGSSNVYLYVDSTLNTVVSNNGVGISTITLDYNGNPRSATRPDLGAYEGNYTSTDVMAPSIFTVPLTNIGTTTSNINVTATINDPSTVGTATTNSEPRIYYKKTGGTYVASSGSLVTGNTLNGTWSFAISPTLLGGLTLGDTISYYLVAQDALGNLGSAPLGVVGSSVTSITTDPNPFTLLVVSALSGNYTVCNLGCDFNSLTNANGAFDSINKSSLMGDVQLLIAGDLTAETGTISLNQIANGNNFKITIAPNSATERLIRGNGTNLVYFNGADRVTIDGRFASSGRYLRFRNVNTGGSTIRFGNDAVSDTVRFAILEGNTQAVGTVYFSAPAVGGTGNDFNTITQCDIRDTLGNGLNPSLTISPVQNTGFYSDGNLNSNNNISFNNIYNFIYQGVNIAANLVGNDNWTIHQNAFYQLPAAAAKAGNVGSVSTQAIRISSGQGHTITNNSIGGAAPDRSGAAWRGGYLSFGAVSFRGIELQTNLGMDMLTTISGNVISNIDANPFGGSNLFGGILVSSGLVNVTNNTIGGGAMPYDTIKEGSYSTTNVGGIILAGGIVNVSNNTVGNIYNYLDNAGNTAIIRTVGINLAGGGTAPIAFTVANNTIRDIRSTFYNSPTNILTYTASSPVGIFVNTAANIQSSIVGNTIYNIQNTQTVGTTGQAVGISLRGGSNIVERNRIYNLSTSGISTGFESTSLIGIYIQSTSSLGQVVRNNQIALQNNIGNCMLMGIVDATNFASNNNIYNNSVFIGGTNTGSASSYGLFTGVAATPASIKVYNNILYNARSGGSGNHFAIGSYYNASLLNATSFGYNLLVSPTANAVMEMPAGNNMNAAAIQALYTSRSSNSNWVETIANVPANNLFINTSLGNLGLNQNNASAWLANGKGIANTFVSNDFNAVNRSTSIANGATDIGAVEITPSVAPASAIASAAPAANTTTNYTYGGRTIATITWGNAGTLPTALDVKYYTGTNAPSLISSRTQFNAYYTITPIGGTGYTYNLAVSYDSAVMGNVSSTSAVRLAQFTTANSNWNYLTGSSANSTSGMLSAGSNLLASSLPANFTGTDNNNALPVSLISFTANTVNQQVILNWVTANEKMNKGFDVERSVNGLDFEWVGFVNGAGNSNATNSYQLKDNNAFINNNTNVLYYRLKQVDYNGKITYSNMVTVSMDGLVNKELSMFPNPTKDKFQITVNTSNAANMEISIIDIHGKVLANYINPTNAGTNAVEIDAAEIPAGLYFVRVVIGNEINVLKLIKH